MPVGFFWINNVEAKAEGTIYYWLAGLGSS